MSIKKARAKNFIPVQGGKLEAKMHYSDTVAYDGVGSGMDLLTKGIKLITEKWKNPSEDSYITFSEFDPALCVDNAGKTVVPKAVMVEYTRIRDMTRSEESQHRILTELEMHLGAPYLKKPALDMSRLLSNVKSAEQVEMMAAKINRKIAKEQKDLKDLCAIELKDPQTPESQGQFDAISFVRSLSREPIQDFITAVANKLFYKIVERERDRLFYIRRHPSNATMHSCQNGEILAFINTLVWVLGSNPFIGREPCLGRATF
jgi:hypothetical protein